jgi:hypothetical protein
MEDDYYPLSDYSGNQFLPRLKYLLENLSAQKPPRTVAPRPPPPDPVNVVVDWLKLQNFSDPGEEAYVQRRNLNTRKIELQHSGTKPVLIKITSDPKTVVSWSELSLPWSPRFPRGMDYQTPNGKTFPGTKFILQPGTSRFLAINSYDGPIQYMHILDPISENSIGLPMETRHNAQIFVLREGIQGYFFQTFGSTGYEAKY